MASLSPLGGPQLFSRFGVPVAMPDATKHMIFHHPGVLDPEGYPAASQIRPLTMLKTFRSLGYQVDTVMGTAAERARQITAILGNLRAGRSYEFLYSESVDFPTLLTTPSHLPLHPWLDYRLFAALHKAGVPQGAFYRDIRWRFPEYWRQLGRIKGGYGYFFFLVDLWIYKRYFDVIYVPATPMLDYFPRRLRPFGLALPPGCLPPSAPCKRYTGGPLHVLYIGGLSRYSNSVYDLQSLAKAMKLVPDCRLTICCRESEWEISELKRYLDQSPTENIQIVHRSGEALNELYAEAHLLALTMGSHVYHGITIPFKSFEYIAHQGPILCTTGTAVGRFMAEKGVGIVVDDTPEAIAASLRQITVTPSQLTPLYEKLQTLPSSESWEQRALYVRDTLTGRRR
jgi:hypothetical protein